MSVIQPICSKCSKTESIYWNRGEDGTATCIDCFDGLNAGHGFKELEQEKNKHEENGPKIATRRSTRASGNTKARCSYVVPKKGKGRRAIFKKNGQLFQIGDIVSVCDVDDKIYYCQLRGFLTDQYCEKSAVITWLIPSDRSPPPEEGFDAATYMIGVEEDIPRKMDCFEFIMHAPSDYYMSKTTPYPPVNYESCLPRTHTILTNNSFD
ncbi:GATA zinc finger domain-containing protein 1 isoform X2 [Lycorma delicatula]|uniref:GATA zinc finger domain-containing protein 1 isoform X2 n=1 Tax=Lycorma delicatula TaxID=130591 RepID=UPI003F514512